MRLAAIRRETLLLRSLPTACLASAANRKAHSPIPAAIGLRPSAKGQQEPRIRPPSVACSMAGQWAAVIGRARYLIGLGLAASRSSSHEPDLSALCRDLSP
jgi:hypothetical protein